MNNWIIWISLEPQTKKSWMREMKNRNPEIFLSNHKSLDERDEMLDYLDFSRTTNKKILDERDEKQKS